MRALYTLLKFGGPDGELAASMRYLAQRYTMPYKEVTGILTDIGTEELAHLEIICAIVHQLTRNLTPEQIEKEFKGVLDLIMDVYKDFGFKNYKCRLSLRDPEDKEKYHELMALLMALNNDDFWGGQEDEKSTFDFMQFSSTFDDGADCTGDNESSYGTGMFKKSHIKISQVDKLCG